LKPRSPNHVFVIALLVLALFVAETFGIRAGYVCMCGDRPVLTHSSHCDLPHGANRHADDAKTGAPHDDGDSDERKDHEVVRQHVQSRALEAAPQVIAPRVLLAILPVVQMLPAGYETKIPASYSLDFGESPPFGVTVARTIVLLI
jgi:hypothetical protein